MSSPPPSSPPPPTVTLADIEKLRTAIGRYFTIYDSRVTPASLIFLVNVNDATLEQNFNALAQDLWEQYYVPQVRYAGGEHVIEVVRRPARQPWGGAVNFVMLGLTLLTSVFAGAFLWVAYNGGNTFRLSDLFWGGVFFAAPLLAILGLHELAHFFMARRHRVAASMPFFLPMPPPWVIFGTFGAFISLRQPIPDKKALMDIGVSGPIAGFIVAIPVTIAGLFLSIHAPVLPLGNCGPVFLGVPYGGMLFGSSLVFYGLSLFFPLGMTNLDPLAIAGWVGILITSINLLPAGQLDGGHVFRALLGKNSVWLSLAVVAALIALGFFYPGWFIFAFLVLILGIRHPPPLNDLSPLDLKRKAVGVLAAGILVGGFALIPIASATGSFSTPTHANVSAYDPNATWANLSFAITNQDLVSHGYYVSASLNPEMNATGLARYFANITGCSLRFAQTAVPCNVTEVWPNLQIAQSPLIPVDGNGASVPVELSFQDALPSEFTGSFTVREHCTYEGVNSGPDTISFTY